MKKAANKTDQFLPWFLASKEISFAEAAKKIDEIKSWKHTRDTFLREVNISTWEEVQRHFPQYAEKKML